MVSSEKGVRIEPSAGGRLRFFPLLFCILVGANAHATITITGVVGASGAANIPTPTTTTVGQVSTPTIYGGLGGSKCTGADSNSTCSSCNGTGACANPSQTLADNTPANWPFCICNANRIWDGLALTINFTSSTSPGRPYYTGGSIASGSQQPTLGTADSQYQAAGTASFITIPWTQICQNVFSPGNFCENILGTSPTQTTTLTVGLINNTTGQTTLSYADQISITITLMNPSNNPTPSNQIDDCNGTTGGLCNWRAYPGDGKIYLEETQGDNGFNGTSITGIRVFGSTTDFDSANPSSTLFKDMAVGMDGSISDNVFDGLNNDPPVPYHFRVAVRDPANNVFAFTSEYNIQNSGLCTYTAASPKDTDPTDKCRYHAEPDQVLGLLSKDINCFIATAAYGSAMEPKIDTFREFRHKYLLLSPWGRKFVMAYYSWGPYAARWIHDRDWARFVARAFLWPVWGFAYVSLKWGLAKALTVTIAGLIMMVLLSVRWAMRLRTA